MASTLESARDFDNWFDWNGATTAVGPPATANVQTVRPSPPPPPPPLPPPLPPPPPPPPSHDQNLPISPVSITLTDFNASTAAHLPTLAASTTPLPQDLPTPRHSSGSPEARPTPDIRLSGETVRPCPASSSPSSKGVTSRKRKFARHDVPSLDALLDEPAAPAKRRPHNMIEKRYRANLNEKIAELRDSVPSLRLAKKTKVKHKDGSDETDGNDDDLDGLAPSNKLNKASILTKAVEYIRHLELRTRRLEEENRALRERMAELDRAIAHRPLDSQRATALTSQPVIAHGPGSNHQAQDGKPDSATVADEQWCGQSEAPAPRGLIPMPDSWRRLRQGQSQPEHYGHMYDTPSGRSAFRGKWPTRLMLGSLAGIVLMDGLSEPDAGSDSKAKGLFGIPLELLDGWTFLNSPRVYLAMFAQYARAGGVFPLVKGFCALTIVAFLIFAYLFNSKPAPKADLEGDPVCSDQRPAPASPIEVRRRAWSTSLQVLKLPHHSFFPEWLAVTSEWLKWSISHLFGYRVYFWLTGCSAEDDAIRIKAWDIAIDAQLAGGDPEASRSRVVLTSFASGTLPRTPLRLMLKALHSRLLLWNVGQAGSLASRLANNLATFVANREWLQARELHALGPSSSGLSSSDLSSSGPSSSDLSSSGPSSPDPSSSGPSSSDPSSSDPLPAYLAELLAMECENVFTPSVLQRAYNLMYDRPTGEQAEDSMLDVVVEDHAVRSPLDAVAAWRSISALKTALDMSLQNPAQVHLFQEHLALALRIAPPGSAAKTRALAALALFGVSNRQACAMRASEMLQSPTNPDAAHSTTAQVPYFIDSSTPPSARAEVENCLQCARICITFEEDGDVPKALDQFYQRPLKPCTDSLMTAAALKHVAAVIPGLDDQLLEVGTSPLWMLSPTDRRSWSPPRLKRPRPQQRRRHSNISHDTGYGSLSDDSENNELLSVN